jgi:phage repressor protein C with HTH and peptisase S24 domain/DNA-binding transcriptional regulator YiaG
MSNLFHDRQENAFQADIAKEQNLIGIELHARRKALGLKQSDVSKALRTLGIDTSPQIVSKWERGDVTPNVYQFLALCCFLKLNPAVFTGDIPSDSTMNDADLNEDGQQRVREFRNYLISTGKYQPKPYIKQIAISVSRYKASAGNGFDLSNGDDFEKILFPEDRIPAGTDFGVRIDGDSMEPVYHDGQLIWVKQTAYLNPGEVGLFILDGKGYVKRYELKTPAFPSLEEFTDSNGVLRKQPVLVSYNETYEPMFVSPEMDFRICGKVLN